MSRSRYAERFTGGKELLKQIQDDQIGRLRSLQRINHRRNQIEDWADLAKSEAGVKERYRGRYLFELIQNANDAIVDQAEVTIQNQFANHHLVRLELTEKSLLVANFGQPFGEQNVRALCRLHRTTKSVSKQIGHKGIGFKSVLEISTRPEVYSIGETISYAFGFDGDQFRADVAEVMGGDWDPDVALPILRTPYFRNINQLPKHDRERIEALFDDGYVTVVRLPWEDGEQAKAVEHRLREDIQPTLLLFMPAISQIDVVLPDGKEFSYWRQERLLDGEDAKQVILYRAEDSQQIEDSRWLVLGPIERDLKDTSLVKDLGEAWQEVHALTFSLAFPLERLTGGLALGQNSQTFYVYFPTQEYSGLRFAVQADFHVRDDRKHLDPIPLNCWLVEEIAIYLANEGISLMKGYLPNSPQLVELLAPVSYPESSFSQLFSQKYLDCMRLAPFVPVDGGQYKAPVDCRFPPAEANQHSFRQLFPAARLRGHDRWAYPIPEVIEAELARTPKFLLDSRLGAREVDAIEVIESLRHTGMPPLDNAKHLIMFLADWWHAIPQHRKPEFEKGLRELPIFPTRNGWQRPTQDNESGIVFQANLRPDVEDMTAPAGFDFSVIVRSVYPTENATYSNQYQLFRALGAREYQNRVLIQSAILPVLTNPDQLRSLASDHPSSILEGLQLLKSYYADDGATGGFADHLPRVLVPASDGKEGGWQGWKPAGECYLGRTWPDGFALEQVFLDLDDTFFVREIPGLELETEDERVSWANFLQWLGVAGQPRVIAAGCHIRATSEAPFGDHRSWQDYLEEHRRDFICTNSAADHGERRYLVDVHMLHHFGDIVLSGDETRLRHIFDLLARNWTRHYQKYAKTTVRCTYERCPRDDVEDYFLFALRHLPWLESALGSRRQLLAPCHIWVLGETEPQDVRSLVPTLATTLQQTYSRELVDALGFMSSGVAQVEDYVHLLGFLARQYPRDAWPAGFAERSRRTPLTTTFNWALERIQTGLVARGDQPTACPAGLRLLAVGKDGLEYLERESPRLAYADDPFMEQRWQQHCAYLLCNDDWRRLRDWLGVPNLSSVVEAEWEIGTELDVETARLRARFSAMLPYFLALAYKRQPSAYERILPRLRRLNLHVVDSLTAHESIRRLPQSPTISTPAQAFLRLSEETRVRAGDLFCTPEVLNNPDILGDYVAGYIEITGLSDAFVLLMERDEEARERFVLGKGATREMLDRARADLGEPESTTEGSSEYISELVDGKLSLDNGSTWSRPSGAGQATGNELPPGGIIHQPPKSYPPLNLENASSPVPAAEHPATTPSVKNSGSGGGGTILVVAGQETKEALGRRGEQWAFECEKRRLSDLGLDPDIPENHGLLEWASARNPTSSYDIRSVDENLNEIYIEVKASSDRGRVIHLSLSELELALQKGEQYWLYWVGNVGAEQPDPPECYKNFALWLREKRVTVDVDSLRITLRVPASHV